MTSTQKRIDKLIDPDIRRAQTLPAEFYRDPKYFELAKERIFAHSWQFALDVDELPATGSMVPWTFLPEYVNEPLLFTRDSEQRVHCLSNVCTHRGALLVQEPCATTNMRCRYHGRRFAADGKFVSAPGFDDADNFPTESDNLASAKQELFGNFIFVALDPAFAFEEFSRDMMRRVSWLPLHAAKKLDEQCHDYYINANWALYVENYLEGLHVPYVHPGLATVVDTKDYRYEVNKFCNLQIGLASHADDAFDIPPGFPEHGTRILAYYFWLFPNLMLNFYPWGISMNIVMPLAWNKTCIRYRTYVYDESRLASNSPKLIQRTEYEDQTIVQEVHQGMQARLYKRGRYSPQWEPNVHHFHTLLSEYLA